MGLNIFSSFFDAKQIIFKNECSGMYKLNKYQDLPTYELYAAINTYTIVFTAIMRATDDRVYIKK